jgi:site-specific DNA-methyltransferase (adenine-specific)
MLNKILLGDCYELMKDIPDGSIDLVLTDPPYNTSCLSWDQQPIDLPELWKHLKRVLKPKGAVVMTGSQPFTTDLINSNRTWFKYCLVWEKDQPSNFLNAKQRPLSYHEDIIIFNVFTYNPLMTYAGNFSNQPQLGKYNGNVYGKAIGETTFNPSLYRYPKSIMKFNKTKHNQINGGLHPTQKPFELFEYLIRTYSNPGETILDPFCGSCTTSIAAFNTGRNCISIEREEKYYKIGLERLRNAQAQLRFEEMVG